MELPQTKEEIQRFAESRGLDIEWQIHPAAIAPDGAEPVAVDRPAPVVQTGAPAAIQVAAAPQVVTASGAEASPATNQGAASPAVAPSAAEQITRLERTIEEDSQRLEAFRADLANPEGEYQEAESEFKATEEELAALQAEIVELRTAGQADALKAAEEALKPIQAKHDLCRERFDLAIQTRKTVQEQVAALEVKISQNRLARDKLTGVAPPVTPEPQLLAQPAIEPGLAGPAPAATAPPAVAAAAPAALAPAESTAQAEPAAAPPPAAQPAVQPPTAVPASQEPIRAELVEAQQNAEQKKAEARVAELEVQSITERIQTLDTSIGLEQKLFQAARKKADIVYQQQRAIQAEHQEKSEAGAPLLELRALVQKRKDTAELFEKARAEVAERTDRLSQLQAERTALQAEELAALKAAEEKQGEAAHAEEKVGTLKNPFSIHNMLQWSLDHGVKVSLILAGTLFLRLLLKLTTKRFVDLMVKSGARGTKEERENRATTLVGVFQNAGSLAIIVSGTLMMCDEIGIAVGPLMGGAAVIGLAVAFGAQNLIRDYFYGFVILLENQYKINDVLKIGDVAGQVERITLRMTVLRDLQGRVHFIPNGKIDSVTNMTHGWSRAVFEIGVAYKEDADEVMKVLMDLAQGLRRDPIMAPMILDDPEMLGVDSFGDSAVVLKFLLKTRPLKQWAVKRELLRRIKRRFDELGIEIPFPHRTLYHHHSAAEASHDDRDEFHDRRAA